VAIHAKLGNLWTQARESADVLQDILVTLKHGSYDPKGRLMRTSDTVIKASEMYKPEQIGNLFVGSQSMMSLALSSDSDQNTVSAVIFPSANSGLSVSDIITYDNATGKKKESGLAPVSQGITILQTLAEGVEFRLRKVKKMWRVQHAIIRNFEGLVPASTLTLVLQSTLWKVFRAVSYFDFPVCRSDGDSPNERWVSVEEKPSIG
jgi:hypothetical protein